MGFSRNEGLGEYMTLFAPSGNPYFITPLAWFLVEPASDSLVNYLSLLISLSTPANLIE